MTSKEGLSRPLIGPVWRGFHRFGFSRTAPSYGMLIRGDEEYRSEEALTRLAKILPAKSKFLQSVGEINSLRIGWRKAGSLH